MPILPVLVSFHPFRGRGLIFSVDEFVFLVLVEMFAAVHIQDLSGDGEIFQQEQDGSGNSLGR